MGKKKKRNRKAQFTRNPAKNSRTSENPAMEFPASTPLRGAEDAPPSTGERKLDLVCPDPSQGFQPLSNYLRARITKRVIDHMRKICSERDVALDFNFWLHCTGCILGQSSTEETVIAPAPAGSGKSTWIEAFTTAIVEIFLDKPELSRSLVGVTLVLQKVEDLNRLAEILNADSPKDNPNMVALQGWSQSGQRQGFCRNTAVQRFDECIPSHCPFAEDCELRSFKQRSLLAPVVGLTQERFSMLRDSGNLDSVLYRILDGGQPLPRRFLIFDEKFQMTQVSSLDKNTIDEASMEITKLIAKQSASDARGVSKLFHSDVLLFF